MKKIKSIKIVRAEGRTDIGMVGVPYYAMSWEEASDILFNLSYTAPKEGYDKTEFTVVFEDEFTYSGTYDLKHHSIEYPSLYDHMKGNILFHSGLRKPHWIKKEVYESLLENTNTDMHKEIAIEYLGINLGEYGYQY